MNTVSETKFQLIEIVSYLQMCEQYSANYSQRLCMIMISHTQSEKHFNLFHADLYIPPLSIKIITQEKKVISVVCKVCLFDKEYVQFVR